MNALSRQSIVSGISALALALSAGLACADKDDNTTFTARLSGFQEVPSVSTVARGEFKGKLDPRTGVIDYEFAYEGLQGTVTQAHIHFGQRGVNGGITVWLCQSATNPAPDAVKSTTPACTSPSGSFTGVINATSVVGPGGAQQLGATELAELIKAMRAGVTYVNVHTSISSGGEIRGQIRSRH